MSLPSPSKREQSTTLMSHSPAASAAPAVERGGTSSRARSLVQQSIDSKRRHPIDKLQLLKTAFKSDFYRFLNASCVEKIRLQLQSTVLNVLILILTAIFAVCSIIKLVLIYLTLISGSSNEYVRDLFDLVDSFSLAIAGTFMFELILKLSLTPKMLLRTYFELADPVVILTSFLLQICYLIKRDDILAILGMILVFRFWRWILIIDDIIDVFLRYFYESIDELRSNVGELIEENKKLELDLQRLVISNLLTIDYKAIRANAAATAASATTTSTSTSKSTTASTANNKRSSDNIKLDLSSS